MSFRDRLDMEVLLKALDISFERHGVKLVAICPNPDHMDTNPSWTMVDSPGTWKHGGHRCFSCGFGGGPWELVMAVRGVDEEVASEFVGALVTGNARKFPGVPRVLIRMKPAIRPEYELPSGVQIPSLDGSKWPDPFAEYLSARGVTEDQIVRWHLGFATRGDLAWRVVIPVHTRGRLVAHVARAIFEDRPRYDMPRMAAGALPSAAVFGEPLIDPALRILTISEGSFSKLALERAGAPNSNAILGSDWSVDKASILTSVQWDSVIVATDPDPAGDRVARAIAMSFRRSTILRLRLDKSPDDCELDRLRDALIELMQRPAQLRVGDGSIRRSR